MRREWSGWIKHRRWEAFEQEAKAEPSQLLADTVGELERGFSEKADRRALKKVLYLLAQAGFEPSEVDEALGEPEEVRPPYAAGLMASADPSGSSFVAYGVEEAGKVVWLRATISETYGVEEASEGSCPADQAPLQLERMLQSMRAPMVASLVPPEYALSRLARALARQKGRAPSVVAYWGRYLGRAEELPHPSEAMKPADAGEDRRYELAMTLAPALGWRLELGTASARIMEFAQAVDEEEGPDAIGPKRDAWMEENRSVLFTPDVVADHAMRLRDLAFLLQVAQPEEAGLALAAAIDLERRGPESDYARAVVDKTMYVTMRHLKSSAGR